MFSGTYLVEFERIGRNGFVLPLTVAVASEADLARRIRDYARPHLRSADFDVMIDADAMAGWLTCGMHSGGNFSITPKH